MISEFDLPVPFRSIRHLSKLLSRGEVTSTALTSMYLERLEKQGRSFNAVAQMLPEYALQAANDADRARNTGGDRSTLTGIPFGAKDLFAAVGTHTRWGSPAHDDVGWNFDAAAVAALKSAGAILAAKLAMVELAGGGSYSGAGASSTGPCLNPWNREHWAGGSSSGSGAAVAAGAVACALGSETWGSVTVPAAFCGVTGLRPTYGRISRYGAMALSWSMDKVGILARTADDCGILLSALAGADVRDPSCTGPSFNWVPGHFKAEDLRVGILAHDMTRTPEVEQSFMAAIDTLVLCGLHPVPAELNLTAPVDSVASFIIMAEGSAAHREFILSNKLTQLADSVQQAGLLAGLAITTSDYIRAQQIRTVAVNQLNQIWKDFDLLVAPTLLTEALPVDRPFVDNETPWGGNGGPGNLAGWPSISLPMGFGPNALPLGLELIAPPFAEEALLHVAHAYQLKTDWHLRLPLCV